MKTVKRQDLVYPELSYKIIGILFEVFRQLGWGHREKSYQRAIASELRRAGLKYQEQPPLIYKEERIGSYSLDFLIENEVILEIEKDKGFARQNIEQVYSYLRGFRLKLGIIAVFTKDGVKYRRILNVK